MYLNISSVQSVSHVQLFATPWTAACQASCCSQPLESIKLMSVASVMPSNHLILCCPLLLPPSIFPSIRVFSSESVLCIRWPEYWSFSFSLSPSSEYSGLISFRMDWLHLLAVQGTLESSPTPQFKGINSLALSFPYNPTLTSIHDYWKNHRISHFQNVTLQKKRLFWSPGLCISQFWLGILLWKRGEKKVRHICLLENKSISFKKILTASFTFI